MMIYWYVYIGNTLLLKNDNGKYSVPCQETPPTEIREWTYIQNLPDTEDGTPCKSYKLDNVLPGVEKFETIGLRESWNLLPRSQYNMAGKAAELIYWDSNTKYCGCCGAPMKRSTDISKVCTICGKEIWPQVSPAIIVRIHKGDQIMLVHAKNFRRSEMYGLVAGFVETGETLEECVRREVKEEIGLSIKNIKYFASQPWPYPCGIMLGFTADYDSGEIHLQEEEIADARWVSKNNLPVIPDKMSIARRLIDDWLENC